MFAKLAQKYRVPNPLKKAESPTRGFSTPVLNTAAGFGTSEASQLPPSALGASQTTSSFTSQKAQLNASPFMSTSVQDRSGQPLFGDTSTKSALAPTFATSTMSSPSPFGFGQQSSGNTTSQLSPFEQTSSVDPSPFDRGGGSSQVIPMPSAVGVTFGGKSPRDLLTAFYQQINPSKIAEVDKLLSKYQVRIETHFHVVERSIYAQPKAYFYFPVPNNPGPRRPAV